VLILPHGGRILGLFAPNSSENFLWTHPALSSAESARAFYEGTQWHNSGGDRTWLAPEADFFFPDFPDLGRYWQQRDLDPGNYRVVRNGGALKLVNSLAPELSRLKQRIGLEIAKWIAPAPNPLRYEPYFDRLERIEYAGYTLHTSLQLDESTAEHSAIGLWNLLQMPHRGEMLIPTYARAEPKIYMGTIGTDHLVVTEHLVRYRMSALGEQKMAIRGVATTGRAGYIYPAGGRLALVIRNYCVNPSGEYVDVPWRETETFGYCFQACNVNGGLGSFSELEYHVPAIRKGTGRCHCEDVSQVWAFRGSKEQIQIIARQLLSPEAE